MQYTVRSVDKIFGFGEILKNKRESRTRASELDQFLITREAK